MKKCDEKINVENTNGIMHNVSMNNEIHIHIILPWNFMKEDMNN